ncbi:hypothetical protein BGW36DRAFT_397720 [Talaromyces proteolyticus]|uniref:Uncharacterized protein n=1 Tax=Talaromyces proteolyticus TaxID=1131652 RepID=A0AAD4KNQ9_9EURO|nr:uncharacterized protein BGW36DRAFT_397720 [Talaromyces proteolyticus]KAH8696084.1 hypothetical protein BGW36DRAFT_397720 [Talaromyces proteolyticus]
MSISALLNPPQHKPEPEALSTDIQFSLQYDNPLQSHQSPQPLHPDNKLTPKRKSSLDKSSVDYRYERFENAPSTTTVRRDRRRAPRPKYMEEEMYFIWYHRIDLEEDWKECADAFNRQFPTQGRNVQGIQCKFYRFINSKRCPTVREQRRLKDDQLVGSRRPRAERLPKYGVIEWCNVWYPWMNADHAVPGLQVGPKATPVGRGDDQRTSYSRSSSEASSPDPYSPGSYSDETESQEEDAH